MLPRVLTSPAGSAVAEPFVLAATFNNDGPSPALYALYTDNNNDASASAFGKVIDATLHQYDDNDAVLLPTDILLSTFDDGIVISFVVPPITADIFGIVVPVVV